MSIWLRIILAVIVAAHGIGHLLFLVPLLGVADWGQTAESWLLGNGWVARVLGSLIWLAAIVGFLAAALGIWQETSWWPAVIVVATAVSLIGLVLFLARPFSSPVLSAMVFDLLVLAALFVFQWLPEVKASSF